MSKVKETVIKVEYYNGDSHKLQFKGDYFHHEYIHSGDITNLLTTIQNTMKTLGYDAYLIDVLCQNYQVDSDYVVEVRLLHNYSIMSDIFKE